jgi:hypothetical protein
MQIEILLSRIGSMFAEMHMPEPAFGALVQAGLSALVINPIDYDLYAIGKSRWQDLSHAQLSSNLGTRPSSLPR